jgi:polar amino acid transport system substrate-binding protein
MGGMPHTRSAEAEIDFSQTYWMQDDVPIAIGVAENDSLMRDLVNATLQAMVEDGTWNALVSDFTDDPQPFVPEQWYGSVPSPKDLSVNSQAQAETRLSRDAQLKIAFLTRPGFINTTTGGNPSGYLPDLARELNRRLTGNSDAILMPMETAPSLPSDEFDLFIGPQTHIWSLEPEVDFSQTFYSDGLALIARSGSSVEGTADLHNRPVALLSTATSLALYEEAIANADVTPILLPVSDTTEAVALLEDSKVDAVLIHGYPAARLLAARVPDAILTPGRHGPILPQVIVVPPNDSPLRDAVNLALQDMLNDGALAELHDRYLGGDSPYPIEIWPLN